MKYTYEYFKRKLNKCLVSKLKQRLISTGTAFIPYIIVWSAPSHYLNQCRNIINSNLRNKFQWNLKRNSHIFIQANAFQIVDCEMATICRGLHMLIRTNFGLQKPVSMDVKHSQAPITKSIQTFIAWLEHNMVAFDVLKFVWDAYTIKWAMDDVFSRPKIVQYY